MFESRRRLNLIPLMLFCADIGSLLLVFSSVYRIRMGEWAHWRVTGPTLDLFVIIYAISLYLFDVYRLRVDMNQSKVIFKVVLATCIGAVLAVVLTYLRGPEYRGGMAGRGVFLASTVLFLALGIVWRILVLEWIQVNHRRTQWLFVGGGDFALKFWKDIKGTFFESQVTFVVAENVPNSIANFSSTGSLALRSWAEITQPVYVGYENLSALLSRSWTGVVVDDGLELPQAVQERIMKGRFEGLLVMDLVEFYETFFMKVPVYCLRPSWFMLSRGFQLQQDGWSLRMKRLIDVFLASFLLILVLPIFPLIALAVKLSGRGPVIYRQTRAGEGQRQFTILKFRTMVVDAEGDVAQWASLNDKRVTSVGRFLRSSRLDELPQLLNILKGEMSFIGPRPERPEFNSTLEKTIPFFLLRNVVKPGLTGWAQVNFPYGASIEDAKEKLQYDLYYLKNYSVWLDLIIVLRTIRTVLWNKGR